MADRAASAFDTASIDARSLFDGPDAAAFDSRVEDLASDDASGANERDGLQTLFEFDPSTGELHWSCSAAVERLLAAPNISTRQHKADFDARIVGDVDLVRANAFDGAAETYVCEFQLRRDDGETTWVEERGGWIGAGEARRLISVVRSLESEKRREQRLSEMATSDELTGLLNRSALTRKLDDRLAAMAVDGAGCAYVLAGIDDLGQVNSDFGFRVADEVICGIAARLEAVLGPKDVIGRYAGTKFGMVLADRDESALRETCVRLMNAVRADVFETQSGSVASSICLGVVELPMTAETSEQAMTQAEAALDEARRLGASSWSVFSDKTDRVSRRRRNTQMSDVILTALNERRVRLAFQPIVSDLNVVPQKYECLIRMLSDEGREVPAPEFIPVAERLGLVHLLDRRVLELATNTLEVCPDVSLAVNVSMETVKDPVWAEGYLAHMRAHQHLCNRITVELTETQVIDAIDASIEFVSEIKRLGARFAIDDFGAGYTSFRNLKALDIDILKIDGSFVTGVSSSRENQLFVRTLLDLARNFGMKTVAEWVDNEADAILLKGLGVDFLQGYLIGKPQTAPDWLPEGAPNTPPAATRRL
ncbi:MAG: bifunctional diguanylate cyclase/phosphodiesterase [Pseudomonadota bacterium]